MSSAGQGPTIDGAVVGHPTWRPIDDIRGCGADTLYTTTASRVLMTAAQSGGQLNVASSHTYHSQILIGSPISPVGYFLDCGSDHTHFLLPTAAAVACACEHQTHRVVSLIVTSGTLVRL